MTESRKLILVIDDDEAVFAYMRRKIGSEFDLLTTMQSNRAVDMALRFKPNLVLCDIDMPDVDGGELSTRFYQCERTRRIPFVFLTALIRPGEVDRAKTLNGSRRIIAKATPASEMTRLINGLLH